jgi:signal transduction histidine kinase
MDGDEFKDVNMVLLQVSSISLPVCLRQIKSRLKIRSGHSYLNESQTWLKRPSFRQAIRPGRLRCARWPSSWPLMLHDLGLVPAAEWLTQNFTARTGIRCDFSADPPEIDRHDPHATAVFRILQESLTNIARHAQATCVGVTLDGNTGEIVLRVRDNGCGFDPASPRKPGSLGLVGLRERATLLGGEINISAAPGKGTVIEVHIPLQRAEATT